MQKKIYSLFALLAIFSFVAVAPSAFADHMKVDIDMAIGSSVPGCEENNMCYMPNMVTLDIGGEATWHNIDTAAHTVSSGSPTEGPDGVFDSSLVMVGGMFSYKFEEAGTYNYFCMVHPWMEGLVTVSAEEEHDKMEGMEHSDEMEGMKHSDEHTTKGIEDLSDQFTATTTSGVIHHIGANSDDDTLVVHLFGADDDGKLEIILNRDIITPFDDGSYFVLADSQEVEFMQMGNTLHIDYESGTEKIEIVGSHVVPEFGTIAMIVLAVAIVSIIVLTTKTRATLIPKL